MTTFANRAEVLTQQTEIIANSQTDWEEQQFAAKVATYGPDFEVVTDYDSAAEVGPQWPHNKYVVKTWDKTNECWDFNVEDMTPNEDRFVHNFFQSSEKLQGLRQYCFPWHILEIIRGDRAETVMEYPDGKGGRTSIYLSRLGLMEVAGKDLLKYIL